MQLLKYHFKAILIILCLSPSVLAQELPDKLVIDQVTFSDLEGWEESMSYHSGDMGINGQWNALSSLVNSCRQFLKLPVDVNLGWPAKMVGDWHGICGQAVNLQQEIKQSGHPGDKARKFFEQNFTPFRISNNGKPDALFTGYYEIELSGSRKKTGKYKYPIYKKPKKVSGCMTRAQIESGVLADENLELLYVNDKIDLFFLHIQGSGRVKLEDGSFVRVGYAGRNGCKYSAIGKFLADEGEIARDEISAQTIKAWLRANHKRAQEMMNKNEAYIFFRETGKDGVFGAQGVPLTPEHSIAIDKRFVPFGMPVWVETILPDGTAFNRFTVAQDTGSAIKGPARADIFFGHGKMAEETAGKMQQFGKMYFLIPNAVSVF